MFKNLSTVLVLVVVTLFVAPGIQSHDGVIPTIQADGGLPIPPWPGPSRTIQPYVLAPTTFPLLADGGLPIPPWPPSGGVVV